MVGAGGLPGEGTFEETPCRLPYFPRPFFPLDLQNGYFFILWFKYSPAWGLGNGSDSCLGNVFSEQDQVQEKGVEWRAGGEGRSCLLSVLEMQGRFLCFLAWTKSDTLFLYPSCCLEQQLSRLPLGWGGENPGSRLLVWELAGGFCGVSGVPASLGRSLGKHTEQMLLLPDSSQF